MTLIKFENFTKVYRQKVVLDNVNFEIEEGKVHGIVGMSGAGKTTLLNALIGFIQPDAGDVLFSHNSQFKSVYRCPLVINRMFGFSSQHASVYPQLTVEENLAHFGSLYDLPKKLKYNNMKHLLDLTNLEDARHKLSSQLSGGMQKRLSIACALIHDPQVLILDEPTSDLDPVLRKQTWNIVQEVNKRGTTVVVTSHFLDEVEDNCDDVAVLHKGSILDYGTLDLLKDKYAKNYEVYLSTAEKQYEAIISRLKQYSQIRINDYRISDKLFISSDSYLILHYLLNVVDWSKQRIKQISFSRPKLEAVFRKIIK